MRMGTFFSFLQKKKNFPKMDNIFLPPKKIKEKKKKCGLPTGFKNGHPLDRKQKFFLGWPYIYLLAVVSNCITSITTEFH